MVKTIKENNKLILEFDNGDLEKIEQTMKKWNFKDYQSFTRFAVSTLLLVEDNNLSIKLDGMVKNIVPPANFRKSSRLTPLQQQGG